ncbi:MAG: ABC transporter ATP-binding protein [Anaerolineae bacterium]|nr:ABC transporter ATP-binding protein [Anaerolineae bacterium]
MPQIVNAVEMRGIVKRFPGVLANDHVDFDLCQGEVHALLGENGAGKSTLMNVLAGLYKPEEGAISVEGKRVSFNSPRDAIAAGLGMVHQHFMLVPSQTVTENIILGLEAPRFVLNMAELDKKILALQEQYGLRVDPKAKIWQLSVGEQQRVEILKMLYRGARVLILDEPTAVLTPQEIKEFIATLKGMVASGHSIVFISHKLDEVLAIANRVTVLRHGRATASGVSTAGTTKRKLAELMVGRDVIFFLEKPPATPGPVVLDLQDLKAENDRGLQALKGVSLQVRAGEILGIAGVAGNGQSELAQVITGMRKALSGHVRVNGEDVVNRSPRVAINRQVAHVPEDRNGVGSAPSLSLAENLIMKSYRKAPVGSRLALNRSVIRKQAEELKTAFDIAAPNIDVQARLLSGGNLQKAILAREMSAEPKIIVAVQPTRGLDVGAIEAVQRVLLDERARGTAILLFSEELEEVMALSDRIAVIYEGQIMGEVKPEETTLEQIGLMMAGQRLENIRGETDGHE